MALPYRSPITLPGIQRVSPSISMALTVYKEAADPLHSPNGPRLHYLGHPPAQPHLGKPPPP